MKESKIFGCILSLHLSVIIMLIFQSGCRSVQAPTQIYSQNSSTIGSDSPISEDLTSTARIRVGDGLDAAFNAGVESTDYDSDILNEKTFGVDDVAALEPIVSEGQTVEIVGASYEDYIVIQGDSLWSIAKRYKISVDELYAANDLGENSLLKIGQKIQVPVDGATADVPSVNPDTYQPTSLNQGTMNYKVSRGDTLSSIAKKYDTSVREIKAVNGKISDLIRVGETLILPASDTTLSSISYTASTTSKEIEDFNNTPVAPGTRTHTVKAGDYPSIIARQYGMTVEELLSINGVTDPRKLQIGKVLKVGSSTSSDSTNPIPEPAEFLPVEDNSLVKLKIVQSDPGIEGEVTEVEPDDILEGAIEVPVIRVTD